MTLTTTLNDCPVAAVCEVPISLSPNVCCRHITYLRPNGRPDTLGPSEDRFYAMPPPHCYLGSHGQPLPKIPVNGAEEVSGSHRPVAMGSSRVLLVNLTLLKSHWWPRGTTDIPSFECPKNAGHRHGTRKETLFRRYCSLLFADIGRNSCLYLGDIRQR